MEYDARTALIVVDVQNDFADPAGSLYVRGGDDLVGPINEEIAAATAAGATVVYTQDWHPPSTPHFAKDGGIWPVHCVAGSWGAELHPDLTVVGEHRVHKGTGTGDGYSGFTEHDSSTPTDEALPTGLGGLLQTAGTERIVVVGLAADYCVRATALDGRRLGYPVTAPWSLTRAVDRRPGDGDAARRELAAAGVSVD